jgi:hypothetical protein
MGPGGASRHARQRGACYAVFCVRWQKTRGARGKQDTNCTRRVLTIMLVAVPSLA